MIRRVNDLAVGLSISARRVVTVWVGLLALILGDFTLKLEVVMMMRIETCVEAAALWSQVVSRSAQ